jgi:hypothetical protein
MKRDGYKDRNTVLHDGWKGTYICHCMFVA